MKRKFEDITNIERLLASFRVCGCERAGLADPKMMRNNRDQEAFRTDDIEAV